MVDTQRVLARFEDYKAFRSALHALKQSRFRHYEAYSPTSLAELEDLMPTRGSGVRAWTTAGAFAGLFGFFALCIASALIYNLIVGGKPPVSNVPYIIVSYEGTILVGGVTAMIAVLIYAALRPRELPDWYMPSFSEDNFGISVTYEPRDKQRLYDLLKDAGAVEINETT